MIKCPECGTEVPENAADCPFCGYHLMKQQETEPAEPLSFETAEKTEDAKESPVKKKRRWPAVAAIIVAVLYAVTVITGAFNVPSLQFLIFWRDAPDKVVCDAIDSLKADDWATAKSYWGQGYFNTESGNSSLDSDGMLKLIFQNL